MSSSIREEGAAALSGLALSTSVSERATRLMQAAIILRGGSGYHLIPEYTRDALKSYVLHRIRPGSGLRAILSNDLVQAVSYCDDNVLAGIRPLCTWLRQFAPWACYGSPERVAAWLGGEGESRCADLAEGLEKLGAS